MSTVQQFQAPCNSVASQLTTSATEQIALATCGVATLYMEQTAGGPARFVEELTA